MNRRPLKGVTGASRLLVVVVVLAAVVLLTWLVGAGTAVATDVEDGIG
jgi:hypothetical protein